MYNGINNGELAMKHSVTTSNLSHTIEMSPAEALKIIAKLAEMVALATGPRVASHSNFDGLEVTIPNGQQLLGGLTLVVRPE